MMMRIEDLEQHLTRTPKLADELRQNCTDLKGVVDDTLKIIELPQKAAAKLSDLSTTLGSVSTMLQAVSIVKPIKGPAFQLKCRVDELKNAVDRAQQRAAAIAAKVEWLKHALEDLSGALQKVITLLGELMERSASACRNIEAVHKCIDSIGDPKIKEYGLELLNDFADVCDPSVVHLNDALAEANQRCIEINLELRRFFDLLSGIPKLLSDLDSISGLLGPIMDPLKDLVAALDRKIGIGWFHFTIRQILTRIHFPFEDKFVKAAMKILEPLLKQLHLDITFPEVHGLNIFENMDLSVFAKLLGFMKTLADLETLIENVVAALTNFNVKCPPKPNTPKASAAFAQEMAEAV